MDRERFEQLKQKENEILRGRPVGGVVNGYGADNGLTPEQTIGFINKQSAADEDWKAAKAFYNGSVNQLERGILGTLAMIKDNNIASLQAQGIAVGDGGKYIDMALNSEHLQPYEVKGKTALGQFGLDLASGAGQLVSQAALALTTGGVGSTVAMGASIAGNQYADLRKEGVSVDRATRASVMNAGIQAPLERLSIGNILSKLPAGSGLRQKVVQIAQNAITEGVTEYVQQYPEEITNIYAKNGGNIEELVNKTLEQLPEIHRNGLYAGLIGAVLGGGAGAINVAVRRNVNAAQIEAVENRVEQAKKTGITPEAYANTVNNNMPGSTVSVDGDVLLGFMQSGKADEIAQVLGVTVNEVQQAADEGLTVELAQGSYEGAAMKYADFLPTMRDHTAFEVGGFMQSDTQGQKELQKEYQQFTDNEEEFQAYKDEKIAEMQAAGINQQEALNAMILLESRARVYNPDNPLAFFEAYPIEFRRGTDGGEFNQPEVLDNDTANLRSIQKALEKYNYVAVRGLTGVNAKKKYRKGQRLAPSIDDPDGRGIEFHPELPKLPGTSGIPVSQLMYDDELLKMIEAARQYGENGRIALIAGDSAVDGSDVRETVIKNAKFLGYLDEGKVLEMPGEKAEKKKKPHTMIFSKQDVADYRNMVLDRVVKQYPNLNRLFAWEEASFEERDTYTNLDNYVSQENEKWLKDIDVNKVKKELEEYKSTNVYNQSANEGNRGSIRWNNDGAAIVELFSAADASTFIHESIGHYFANVLAKEAVLPGANEQTVKDFETMLDYAGTTRERWEYLNSKPRPALTKDEDKELVKIQETWATAAEQYILEGKAPNRELQPVFNRFKKWLINVYKTIESFVKNNQYAVPITDEVRQVFDRMLASEQQISEMEKLNGYYAKLPKAITDNLSDAYKTRLYDAMAKAHDKAVQLLTRKSLENFTAERKEQIAEYRADMRPKVAAQVDNEPLYRAEKEAEDMITSGGKQAKTIARRHIDSNAQEYKDWKSELDRVQSDINSRLDPIIQALEAGMGNGVAKVRDDATGRYIRISNNDPWYSDFYRTYKRRPTKTELRDMAYKIYVGEGYNLLPDSVARNAEEEAAYAELKEDIDGLMEYEEELLSYKGEMEQYKGKGLSDEDAYTFNMLAEEYRFSSGDDLAKAILESPTRQQAIKQRLDDEVQKKFPDIYKERRLAEAATQEAFYNDDTGAVLGLEEQIIEDAAKRTLDQQRNAEQQRQLAQMKRQQAKVQAQGYLRSVPLREALRIQKYITAERRAAANAATALAKGDYETALDYKHKQLLAHAMVQESINMNRRYAQNGKFLSRQRKMKKENWGNEENFMQVGALFARMGLRLRGYDERLKQQSLREWADIMQEDYDNVAIADWIYNESRTFAHPLSDLTFDEYEDVVNALKNIRAVVKAQTMMQGEAKAQSVAEMKGAGMEAMDKLPTKYTPDVNKKGKAKALDVFARQLRNSDNLFEMLDNWTYGWFSKHFGEAVRRCADVEAELTMKYEDATRQAYKEWLPDKAARKAADKVVRYEELGTSVNKHTLIYMALNLGNESNAAKLCSTAVNSTFHEFFPQSQLWVEGDVIQTKKNLLEFLGRNLTAADWRYVQKKIDIANMFWTQMSELERRDKGFAPPKVEAYPEIITLADGQQIVFRGGYFPLIRRRDTGSHPASQDAIPSTTGGRPGDSIRTLHTNTGHTKARDNSIYPIDLTPGGEFAVAMDTIHDIAYRETMNNFRKLMNDREFYNKLKEKLGIADMEALEEFLKKAAQPYGGSGFATLSERDTGRMMSWLRSKTVNAAIMLNFKTSLQNLGNPLLYGRVVDGFGYADVLAAYANYQKNWQGRKTFKVMRDFVYSKSVFMRERGQLPDISLRDMKDEGTELNPIEKRTIKWGTQMLTFTDELSALPVWLQAYQKKINANATEDEAVQFANTVIRRTLGSSRITDVAPIQRGGPLMKLITTFQGFFNTQYNQWNREFNIVRRAWGDKQYGTVVGRVSAFAASKFLLFNLINLALAFENPLGDDDDDGWPKIATELLHYPISLLGPVGGVANAMLNNMLDIKDYGYSMTVIEGSLDKMFKAGKLVGDIASGDKEISEATEPVAGVAAMAAGIPNQLTKLFFNAWDILYNDMEAEPRDLFYRRSARDR